MAPSAASHAMKRDNDQCRRRRQRTMA